MLNKRVVIVIAGIFLLSGISLTLAAKVKGLKAPTSVGSLSKTSTKQGRRTTTKSFTVKGLAKMKALTISGSINAFVHSGKEVKVRYTECLGSDGKPLHPVQVKQHGNDIVASFIHRSHHSTFGPPCGYYVRYHILVPKGSSLALQTVSGSIRTQGTKGKVKLRTVSGSIHAKEVKSNKIASVSGAIFLKNAKGSTLLRNVSGVIQASDITGPKIHCKSVSGSVKLHKIQSENIRVKSVNGSIKVTGFVPGKNSYFNTVSGSVYVHPSSAKGFRLTARTAFGGIRSAFPLKDLQRTRRSLSGQYKKGQAHIYMKSLSGQLELRK